MVAMRFEGFSTPKKTDPASPVPHGMSFTAVESLRRRHVQAELQLREMEDRFRRDCSRQERELELLRIENNRIKTKIEEMRMAQTAPQRSTFDGTGFEEDSKLINASSKKYCMAREAVEAAREELNEIRAKLASTRQRIQETRTRRGSSRSRARALEMQAQRSCIEIEEQSRASRMQLRTLEAHVDVETDRLSKLVDDAKNIRRAIDIQLGEQNRTDTLFRDREREMEGVLRETSFLIEVCNVLFEERDECQQQLAELRKTSEGDYEAYEKTFQELVSVEGRDKLVKARLRDNVSKLEEDVMEASKERTTAERVLQDEAVSFALESAGVVDPNNTQEWSASGLSRQLEEFERYISRLMELTGSDSLVDVERFVCGGGEGRFQLYNVLNRAQEDFAALERERAALLEAERTVREGTEADRRAREEVERLQEQLRQTQCDTLDYEQQAEFVRTVLDPALPMVQSIFDALACDVAPIIAERGTPELSRESVKLYLAAIEQRLEVYTAAWTQQQRSQQRQKKQRTDLELDYLQNNSGPMELEKPGSPQGIATPLFPTEQEVQNHNTTLAPELHSNDVTDELLN